MTLAERVLPVAVLAAAGLLLRLPAAFAQSAEAEMLFRDGRTLIKAGKLAAGCDKLDASARLEPSIGTLLNLGDCREKLGKLASAWAAFRKAEAMAKRAGGDDKRQAEAAKRAITLEPNLANLVIEVKQKVDGLVIRRDGELVDPGIWSTAVPLDPGGYKIVAEAPGYTAWRMDVVVGPRQKRQVVLVPLLTRAPVPRVEPPPPVVVVRPVAPPVSPPDGASVEPAPVAMTVRQRTWSGTRKLSVGLAVVGVGAVAGGVYFGTRATELADQSDARCPLTICADAEGLRLNRRAQDAATRANILYVGGGVAVAAATVLWFVGKPSDERVVKPTFGDGQVGLAYGGSF